MLLPRLLAMSNFKKLSKKLCVSSSHYLYYYSSHTLVQAYLFSTASFMAVFIRLSEIKETVDVLEN